MRVTFIYNDSVSVLLAVHCLEHLDLIGMSKFRMIQMAIMMTGGRIKFILAGVLMIFCGIYQKPAPLTRDACEKLVSHLTPQLALRQSLRCSFSTLLSIPTTLVKANYRKS